MITADPGPVFYLGTHQPEWLEFAGVRLFVADPRLRHRKTLPRAIAPWSVDSGGFTELQRKGRWTVEPQAYVDRLRRYAAEIGNVEWMAPQDWMCEPAIIHGGTYGTGKRAAKFVGTHLNVAIHQHRTVANFLRLRELAPELPIIPVLQGYTLDEYVRCIEFYAREGVDLAAEPVVGIGSVCRRSATKEIAAITATIAGAGIRLHGFGVKTLGLGRYGENLVSADSLAWSKRGMYVPGCSPTHKRESNCLKFAMSWRTRVLATAAAPAQLTIPLPLDSVTARLTAARA